MTIRKKRPRLAHFLSFIVNFVLYLSCENKEKEAEIGPFLKKTVIVFGVVVLVKAVLDVVDESAVVIVVKVVTFYVSLSAETSKVLLPIYVGNRMPLCRDRQQYLLAISPYISDYFQSFQAVIFYIKLTW